MRRKHAADGDTSLMPSARTREQSRVLRQLLEDWQPLPARGSPVRAYPPLIFGGSGAIGTMAVQFARQRGAHVIATASGAAPVRLVRKLGAHRVIDARRPESTDQLRKFAPDGLDCVLALAGGDELERCLDFVRPKGRVVHPNGVEPVPMKRPTLRVHAFDAIASPREFDKLNRHLGNGRIRVPIAASYPLGKASQAHRRLDREHVLGRMVLRVRRGPQ